jgi:hypothetical protein
MPAETTNTSNKKPNSNYWIIIFAVALIITISIVFILREQEKESASQLSLRKLPGNETTPPKTELSINSRQQAMAKVRYLQKKIEMGGYKLFYHKGKIIKKEDTLHFLYELTWADNNIFDVNREVNNGRGAVDFKISNGANDKTLVEFKLASNSNLEHIFKQTAIYESANDVTSSIKAILYFSEAHFKKVNRILKKCGRENDPDIILINAINNKPSASCIT